MLRPRRVSTSRGKKSVSQIWVGSKGGRPQRGGKNLGVFVPIWLVITQAPSWPAIQEQTHPKFVPLRWGRPLFDPAQTGLCNFGWVWSSMIKCPLPKRGGFDETGENDEFVFYRVKQGLCSSDPAKTTKHFIPWSNGPSCWGVPVRRCEHCPHHEGTNLYMATCFRAGQKPLKIAAWIFSGPPLGWGFSGPNRATAAADVRCDSHRTPPNRKRYEKISLAMRKPLSLLWIHRNSSTKAPAKIL